jgi:hypothetical protein
MTVVIIVVIGAMAMMVVMPVVVIVVIVVVVTMATVMVAFLFLAVLAARSIAVIVIIIVVIIAVARSVVAGAVPVPARPGAGRAPGARVPEPKGGDAPGAVRRWGVTGQHADVCGTRVRVITLHGVGTALRVGPTPVGARRNGNRKESEQEERWR